MSAVLMRKGFGLTTGLEQSTAQELWYVEATVSGSPTSGQFISEVPRNKGDLFTDPSVTPAPVCKFIRVAQVLGKVSSGQMAAYVYVFFDSNVRYGNTPRSLSSDWALGDEKIEVPIYTAYQTAPGQFVYSRKTEIGRRGRSQRVAVRYGTGDVTDAMIDAASANVGKVFVFTSIPFVLRGHRFSSVNSGYWSVSYTFLTRQPLLGVPSRANGDGGTRVAVPALNYLEEYTDEGTSAGVRTAASQYGAPVALASLPGF